MNNSQYLKSWFLAFRPKTLSAAIVPVLVVTAYLQPSNYWLSFFALFSALCIQIATNLFNDVIDFKKGADNEDRLGPKRATQSGWFSPKKVFFVAIFFCVLAILFGLPLVFSGGSRLLYIGLISILFAYLYTGGPFPLAYLGLGDLFVTLFFGLVACLGTALIYQVSPNLDLLLISLQVGFLCTVLIAINNLRDHINDKKVNKRTLAVILGPQFVRLEIITLYFFSFIIQFYWMFTKSFLVFHLPLYLLPLAIKISLYLYKNEPSEAYNQYLAKASKLYLSFGFLLAVGFLWHI